MCCPVKIKQEFRGECAYFTCSFFLTVLFKTILYDLRHFIHSMLYCKFWFLCNGTCMLIYLSSVNSLIKNFHVKLCCNSKFDAYQFTFCLHAYKTKKFTLGWTNSRKVYLEFRPIFNINGYHKFLQAFIRRVFMCDVWVWELWMLICLIYCSSLINSFILKKLGGK